MDKNHPSSSRSEDKEKSKSDSSKQNIGYKSYDMDQIFKKCTNYKSPEKTLSEKISGMFKKFIDKK